MMSRGQICRLRGWEGRHEPRRAGARTQFHRPAVRFSPPHRRAEFRESRSRRSAASRIFRSARPPNPVPRVGGAARRRRHGRTSGPCANLETARFPCGAGAYPLCNGTVQYQLPGQPRANPPAPGTDCPVLGAMYRQYTSTILPTYRYPGAHRLLQPAKFQIWISHTFFPDRSSGSTCTISSCRLAVSDTSIRTKTWWADAGAAASSPDQPPPRRSHTLLNPAEDCTFVKKNEGRGEARRDGASWGQERNG